MVSENGAKTYKFKSGAEVYVSPASPVAIQAMQHQQELTDPEPEIPVVYIEAKGREEPNPNDPDYQKAHMTWLARLNIRLFNVIVLTATKFKSAPPDMVTPDSTDLDDFMVALDMTIPKGKAQRYLAWIKFIACQGTEEFNDFGLFMARLTGVSEQDIKEAEESFRSKTGRPANPSGPA